MPDGTNDEMNVRVEQDDRGWLVIGDVGGERKEFGDPHPDEETARHYAKHMFAGADRWTGAAEEVAPDPTKYPGDST